MQIKNSILGCLCLFRTSSLNANVTELLKSDHNCRRYCRIKVASFPQTQDKWMDRQTDVYVILYSVQRTSNALDRKYKWHRFIWNTVYNKRLL